ncbi:MAG TPA: recombination protein O N-terminal domain-containing protein, partial [Terriglobales bacterium]|nr:recombination protein O N-terminal domain-containing protein [Terriglobales bacterium]
RASSLQTHPREEADLVVRFFTRDQGKVRSVANEAAQKHFRAGSRTTVPRDSLNPRIERRTGLPVIP